MEAIHFQSMLTMTENMLFQLCGAVEQVRVGEPTNVCSETMASSSMRYNRWFYTELLKAADVQMYLYAKFS